MTLPWHDLQLTSSAATILALGGILAVSILADTVSRRTGLPRISLLVLVGVLVAVFRQQVLGSDGSPLLRDLNEPLIDLALVMVAFLLGGDLSVERLRTTGRAILLMSLAVLGASAVLVGAGLAVLGSPVVVFVSLAAISVATDPAAVHEIIRETGRSDGSSRTSEVLEGIVAIDDAWGILSFGLAVAVLGWITQSAGEAALLAAGWELGGALVLGALIGVPAAWLTGRLRPGEPTRVEAFAVVLLLSGMASWLGVSSLLTAMFAGFLVVNLSRHYDRSFREIEFIEWPFLVFFFVLAGASIDFGHLRQGLLVVVAYIALRTVGRYVGGRAGIRLAGRSSGGMPGDIGLALIPQAGVAMGMALLVAERYPESGPLVVGVTVTSTVFFEVVGPLLVRRVIEER